MGDFILFFNLSIRSYNQRISFNRLVDNFKLDCKISSDNRQILNNGVPLNGDRPIGYTELRYKRNIKSDETVPTFLVGIVCKPPLGPIIDGGKCDKCNRVGPEYHKEYCVHPFQSSIISTSTGKPLTETPVDEKIWPNCMVIKHNFQDKSVSIRIYEDGIITLVACPWNYKDFYKSLLDKLSDSNTIIDREIDNNKNVRFEIGEIRVSSVFSEFNLGSKINLNDVFDLFRDDSEYSMKSIKEYEIGKKEEHNYLFDNGIYYRYVSEFQGNINAAKIILKMIPCVTNEENKISYCKPYKISVLIFAGGKIQLTFSHCDEKELCDEGQYKIPFEIDDQFSEIVTELTRAKDFLVGIIKPPPPPPPKEIEKYIPYKKASKMIPGTPVQIWNPTLMDFTESGIISDVVNVPNPYDYKTPIVMYVINGKGYTDKDIRVLNPSIMQLSANQPTEQNFLSDCKDGKNYHIPFGGEQARDNLFYPKCEKFSKASKELYLNHILRGFPLTPQEQIDFLFDPNSNYDSYSGVFKKDTIVLGAVIETKIPTNQELLRRIPVDILRYATSIQSPEGYVTGKIIDYEKTTDRGLDNILIYHIRLDNNSIIYVTANDFHPKYRQDRRWKGISGTQEEVKNKLIRCTEKLGLSQSPFTTERLQKELADTILAKVTSIVREPFHKTLVLFKGNIRKLTKTPYTAFMFPQEAFRSILYIDSDYTYCIFENKTIIRFDYDCGDSAIIDGWIWTNNNINWTYLPISLLWSKTMGHESNNFISQKTAPSLSLNPTQSRLVLEKSKGRFYGLINFITKTPLRPRGTTRFSISMRNPIEKCAPTPNQTDPHTSSARGSLITDIARLIGPTDQIIFVPQTGMGSWLSWKKNINKPIILEVTPSSKTVSVPDIPELNNVSVKIPIDRTRRFRYLKFWLNIRSDGTLVTNDPIIYDDSTIRDPPTQIPENQTQIIRTILNPIPSTIFTNPHQWVIDNVSGQILRLRSIGGTSPLQEF